MIDIQVKEAFWNVVEDCLVKFHNNSKVGAKSKVQSFRTELESEPDPVGDIIFHEEPFDTACAIAGTPEGDVDQLFDNLFSEYEKILKKRGW